MRDLWNVGSSFFAVQVMAYLAGGNIQATLVLAAVLTFASALRAAAYALHGKKYDGGVSSRMALFLALSATMGAITFLVPRAFSFYVGFVAFLFAYMASEYGRRAGESRLGCLITACPLGINFFVGGAIWLYQEWHQQPRALSEHC